MLGWYNVMEVVCQLSMHDENDHCGIYRFKKQTNWIIVRKPVVTRLRVRIMGVWGGVTT